MRLSNDGLSRRAFLAGLGATATLSACGSSGSGGRPFGTGRVTSPGTDADPRDAPRLGRDPFTLGIASGDPLSDSVVLWTRLAPEPLAPGGTGGMPTVPVAVGWELARDPGMQDVIARGAVQADPAFGHCVHVDLQNLPSDRLLWYRFHTGGRVSAVGRTRTTPRPGSSPSRMRFALASCQSWQRGYYTPYPHLLREDIDVVMFAGDYIYEGGVRGTVRDHDGPETETLGAYRNRYALYKSDPGLQAVHAAFPWIVTWDDHEVDNNHTSVTGSDPNTPLEQYLERRAAAYLAYYEHMPIRVAPPTGPAFPIFRSFQWGDLASTFVLDTRQYRSVHACDSDALAFLCDERFDESRTMLGDEQEAWLFDGLGRSRTRWNLMAQQVMFGSLDFGGIALNTDQWDGYYASRQRILDFVAEQRIRNFVVLSGDIHSSWVMDLSHIPGDPSSGLIGSEIIATGISSTASLPDIVEIGENVLMQQAPLINYVNLREQGYVVCELTRERMRADFRLVETVAQPSSPIRTVSSWEIRSDEPGAMPA